MRPLTWAYAYAYAYDLTVSTSACKPTTVASVTYDGIYHRFVAPLSSHKVTSTSKGKMVAIFATIQVKGENITNVIKSTHPYY